MVAHEMASSHLSFVDRVTRCMLGSVGNWFTMFLFARVRNAQLARETRDAGSF